MNEENLYIPEFKLNLDLISKEETLSVWSYCYYTNIKQIKDHKIHLFNYENEFDNLTGFFRDGLTIITAPLGTSLIEFSNFNFDNFKDFFIFFTKYFEQYNSSYDVTTLNLDNCTDYENIISIVEKLYSNEKSNLKKIQKFFRNAIDCIYNINEKKDLKKLSFKQRFFLFQMTNNNFTEFTLDFNYKQDFFFKYPDEFYNGLQQNSKSILNKIKEYDSKDNKLITGNYYGSSNIYSIFYIILYQLSFIKNIYIKKCKNCNKYFLTTKSNSTYCDNIFKDNNTCKDVGKQLTQIKKQKDEPVYGKYRKIYSQKLMNIKRNPDEYFINKLNSWKKEANQFRKDIKKRN